MQKLVFTSKTPQRNLQFLQIYSLKETNLMHFALDLPRAMRKTGAAYVL